MNRNVLKPKHHVHALPNPWSPSAPPKAGKPAVILAGKPPPSEVKVGALKDSTSQKFAETSMSKAKLTLFGSYDEGVDLLLKSKIDVIVADYQFCALTAYRHQKKGLIAGASPLTFEPLGMAMPEDALLLNWVQNFLNQFHGMGEMKKLNEKWLTAGSWIDDLP